MASFACAVCFEEQRVRLALPKLSTGNGDVLRADDCNHPVCQACMGAFVAARVEQQLVFHVRCPVGGCRNELYQKDVERLVTSGALEASVGASFAELRARDYSTRAKDFAEEKELDMESMKTLWNCTRMCPNCNLVIEKASGCNSFYCICGAHFNYASAPRSVGGDVRNYGKVIDLAQSCRLSLSEAGMFEGDLKAYLKASKIATQLGLPLDEATELLRRAMVGDATARAKIREGRLMAAPDTEQQEEVVHDDTWPFNIPVESTTDDWRGRAAVLIDDSCHPSTARWVWTARRFFWLIIPLLGLLVNYSGRSTVLHIPCARVFCEKTCESAAREGEGDTAAAR